MPLSELPEYIRSVREHGQGGDAPVVEMGRIVDSGSFWDWGLPFAYALAICLFIGGAGTLAVSGTKEVKIVSGADLETVREIVAGEGGVFSVVREGDGSYRVKVFTFERASRLLERLRGNEEFDSVEAD
jgi:hypothetical protein